MNYDERWKRIEVKADKKKVLIKKKFVDTLTGLSLSDFVIINQWLNYAKLINDMSYKNVNLEFLNSEYIYQAMSNQLEFRRKQFLC
jgi:tRNA (Thr-GGU) A37 N-methylase